MAKKNIRNVSVSTIYLQGQELSSDGRPLSAKEKKLTDNEVRVQCAEIIAAKLSEAYASIEVCKKLGIFDDNYADKVINVSKDNNNTNEYRKTYYKKDLFKKINTALEKAGKNKIEVGEVEEVKNNDFE